MVYFCNMMMFWNSHNGAGGGAMPSVWYEVYGGRFVRMGDKAELDAFLAQLPEHETTSLKDGEHLLVTYWEPGFGKMSHHFVTEALGRKLRNGKAQLS